MLGIVGSTGYGKTTALRAFELDNKQVYYLTCQKSMRAKQFFQRLLQTMGVYATGNIYELIERIAAELNAQPRPLVLIDEAGKLTPSLMLYLHDLRNLTEGHAGLVLAGVEYFKTNLEKAVMRQKEGMPEFFDRIAAWEFLGTPTTAELRNVCHANGLTDPERVKQVCKVRNYRALANSIGNELTSL
jgi:DNA transposition AAA+ family ATPase